MPLPKESLYSTCCFKGQKKRKKRKKKKNTRISFFPNYCYALSQIKQCAHLFSVQVLLHDVLKYLLLFYFQRDDAWACSCCLRLPEKLFLEFDWFYYIIQSCRTMLSFYKIKLKSIVYFVEGPVFDLWPTNTIRSTIKTIQLLLR